MKDLHKKSREEFNLFLDQIEDLKVEEEYLISRLQFFIDERGIADKDGKSLRIIESAIQAKRYKLMVQFLESVKSKSYFLNAFKFYLDANSDEIDSDLDYRMLQVMKVAEYQDGIDLFRKKYRGLNPPDNGCDIKLKQTPTGLSGFICAPWKDEVVISSDELEKKSNLQKENLPFSANGTRYRRKEKGVRRKADQKQFDMEELITSSNLSNNHVEVLRNEIEISRDCLRSFMLRKRYPNNELESCSYDGSVSITRL
jgi:hypothetical protein